MNINLAVSIREQLARQGKQNKRPFQELLQYYGLERFLYRLSQTSYAQRFLLKGALMLPVWGSPGSRPPRDIDLLGFVDNDIETLETIIREVCNTEVDDDGLRFDANTVAGSRIKEEADYQGIRIKFVGYCRWLSAFRFAGLASCRKDSLPNRRASCGDLS